MTLTRRRFINLSAKTIAVISAGKLFENFNLTHDSLPPARKLKLRFAIASDGHYGQKNTKFESYHNEMVTWLNGEKKDRGLQFVCINGDLFHDDPAQLIPVKSALDRLSMKYYVSHGNHDMVNEGTWEKTFGTKWHYSFQKGRCGFIVLNTADEKGTYICPDLAWTKAELEKHAEAEALFVFMHITPRKWTGAGIECPELLQMFSTQKNLKLVLHGHDHNEDNLKEYEGKQYCFDSHIGGSWGTRYRGYRIVEVFNDGSLITYQMNPEENSEVNRKELAGQSNFSLTQHNHGRTFG